MLLFHSIVEKSLFANQQLLHVSETKLFLVFICFSAMWTPVLGIKKVSYV